MNDHIFVGFGFGPIQSGLFAAEAFKSGRFNRIVIAEIDPKLVEAIRSVNGSYAVNVASGTGITTQQIDGIEIFNPTVEPDRQAIITALSQATEIVTSLPSVDFYDVGEHSVVSLIKQGLSSNSAKGTVVYTAENNNHAAETLEAKVGTIENVQFLNTVIGKMSQVVTDPSEIAEKQLRPMAAGLDRAFLVEEFNRILVTRCRIPDFRPGIEVFIEKEDLLPFEEAKLYGHNAIHALLAYLGAVKGYSKMAELKGDAELMEIARNAFIHESGRALIQKYADLDDELFTPSGYQAYADDLLSRMTNPYLDDPIDRAVRDPQRKLGLNDRIFGTMQIALKYGIEPVNMAKGALAGIVYWLRQSDPAALPKEVSKIDEKKLCAQDIEKILDYLWSGEKNEYDSQLMKYVTEAV